MPVRIDGAQYSPFFKTKRKSAYRWFPSITLTVFPSLSFEILKNIKVVARRQYIGRELYSTMVNMIFSSSPYQRTLPQALFDAVKIHGRGHKAVEDIERKPMTYQQLIMRSYILGVISPRRQIPLRMSNFIAQCHCFCGLFFWSAFFIIGFRPF